MRKNRVAVITGGASGIGFELAKQCIELGMDIVLADKAVTALCDSVEQLTNESTEVLGIVCDVSKPESVKNLAQKTMERFKRIDWLFNNAGISGELGYVWELAPEGIQKVIDTNLHGAIHCIRTFIPLMTQKNSRIINIASIYGLCAGSNLASYIASKHALVALSESLYFDLKQAGKTHINVSVACPSFTKTNLMDHNPSLSNETIYRTINQLIERSKPADLVAQSIMQGILRNEFYVLPDREAKSYCESRFNDILHQHNPTKNSLEKILTHLMARIETV